MLQHHFPQDWWPQSWVEGLPSSTRGQKFTASHFWKAVPQPCMDLPWHKDILWAGIHLWGLVIIDSRSAAGVTRWEWPHSPTPDCLSAIDPGGLCTSQPSPGSPTHTAGTNYILKGRWHEPPRAPSYKVKPLFHLRRAADPTWKGEAMSRKSKRGSLSKRSIPWAPSHQVCGLNTDSLSQGDSGKKTKREAQWQGREMLWTKTYSVAPVYRDSVLPSTDWKYALMKSLATIQCHWVAEYTPWLKINDQVRNIKLFHLPRHPSQ